MESVSLSASFASSLREKPQNAVKPEVVNKATKIIILTMTSLLTFCTGFTISLNPPIFPPQATAKGISSSTVGLIFASFTFAMFIGSLVFGSVVSTVGYFFLISGGSFLAGGSIVLFGVLDSSPSNSGYIALLFLTRLFEGIGGSMYNTAAYSMVAEVFPNEVSSAFAVLETFNGAGKMFGPLLGGILAKAGGFSLPFYLAGSFVIFSGLLATLVLRYTLKKATVSRAHKTPVESSVGLESFKKWVNFYKMSPDIWLLSLANFSALMLFYYPYTTLSVRLVQLDQPDSIIIGLIFLGGSAAYSLFSPITGKLVDNFQNHLYSILTSGVLVISLGLFFIGPAPFLFQSSVGSTTAAFIFAMAGLAIAVNPIPSAIKIAAKDCGFEDGIGTSAMVASLFKATWFLGSLVGSPISGALVDGVGFEWGAFIVACIGFGVTIVLTIGILLKKFKWLGSKTLEDYAVLYDENQESVSLLHSNQK